MCRGMGVCRLRLIGEFNVRVNAVYVSRETVDVVFMDEDKSVVYVPEPDGWWTWSRGHGLSLELLHIKVGNNGGYW